MLISLPGLLLRPWDGAQSALLLTDIHSFTLACLVLPQTPPCLSASPECPRSVTKRPAAASVSYQGKFMFLNNLFYIYGPN